MAPLLATVATAACAPLSGPGGLTPSALGPSGWRTARAAYGDQPRQSLSLHRPARARGLPILVLLFWIAFVGAPAFVVAWNWLSIPLQSAGLIEPMQVRDFSLLWRAIIALTIAYSSFIAEIFRAGIQAVDVGQIEAAKALGLSRYQRFRLIVWPQAFKTILPPYGNDFIAMVKDSSLVSVLGVADITQMAKVYASGSFRFFETYSIVAYVYLLLTVSLSLGLRALERRMRKERAP